MSICLIRNVKGQYLLDTFIKDNDKLTSIKGHSLYPDKGKSGGWCQFWEILNRDINLYSVLKHLKTNHPFSLSYKKDSKD